MVLKIQVKGARGRVFGKLKNSVMGGWREGRVIAMLKRDDLEASGFDQGWRGRKGVPERGTKHQEPNCEMVSAAIATQRST